MVTHANTQRGAAAAVIEVNERNFREAVLERSQSVPVVVDFWAPWCGPCRALGPTLERLANESQGAFVLAKINVDENPRLAQTFRVQGIPAVKAFRDAQVIDQFDGALPETQVRAWLKRFVSAPSNSLVDAAAEMERTNPAEAAARYRVALGSDPKNEAALFGLGRLLAQQGDSEGTETLREIPAESSLYARAQGWIGLAEFLSLAGAAPLDTQAAQVAASPADMEARYRLAAGYARERRYAEAVEQLLAIVGRNREFREDGARKTLLALFDALGSEERVVTQGRRALANVLF